MGISAIERFPVDDLRVGRGGEIKKLPPVAAGDALARRRAADRGRRRSEGAARRSTPRRSGSRWWSAPRSAASRSSSTRWPGTARRVARWTRSTTRPRTRWPPGSARAGRRITVSSACASGATALGLGADLLREGRGGPGRGRRLRHPLSVRDARLRCAALAHARPRAALRPAPQWAAARRGRRPRAAGAASATRPAGASGRLLGHGSASDASHIAAPDPEGRGLERAIQAALGAAGRRCRRPRFRERARHRDAAQRPDRDARCSGACSAGGRAQVPVNSIKGALGHTMGAAAALEAIMCLLAARDGAAAADGRLRGAGPRLRPRLRAGDLPRRPAAPDAEHVARLRRLQRRTRAGGSREDGRLRPGRGSSDRVGRGRGGAARRRAEAAARRTP